MRRRLLRIVAAAAFGRAWSQRDAKWLSLGLGVLVLRFFDSRAKKRAKRQA
jgi:hypothetical protein